MHKQFTHIVPEKGGVNVQFDIEYDGNKTVIYNISLHSNFESGLPVHPQLKFQEGEWRFYVEYLKQKGDQVITVSEYSNSQLSRDIIHEINKIKDENTPNFSN